MNQVLRAAVAVLSSIPLLASNAFAFCTQTDPFLPNVNGIDTVSCTAQGDSGNNQVDKDGVLNNYVYVVTVAFAESSGGGVLLDSTSSVVTGDRSGGIGRGPCNQSFSVVGSGSRTYTCNNTNAAVAFIRVFVQ